MTLPIVRGAKTCLHCNQPITGPCWRTKEGIYKRYFCCEAHLKTHVLFPYESCCSVEMWKLQRDTFYEEVVIYGRLR